MAHLSEGVDQTSSLMFTQWCFSILL